MVFYIAPQTVLWVGWAGVLLKSVLLLGGAVRAFKMTRWPVVVAQWLFGAVLF